MVATEPLPGGGRAAIGWAGEEGVYTAHEVLESHRLTVDGRIVSGSRYVRYGNRGEPLPDADATHSAAVEAMLRRRFRELEGVAIARAWTGPIGFNLNFLPRLGRSAAGRVSWAVGFAGQATASPSPASPAAGWRGWRATTSRACRS